MPYGQKRTKKYKNENLIFYTPPVGMILVTYHPYGIPLDFETFFLPTFCPCGTVTMHKTIPREV
jgi:hypothetical protein